MKIQKQILELSKLLLYVSSTRMLDVFLDKKQNKGEELRRKMKILLKEVKLAKEIQCKFNPHLKQKIGGLDIAAGQISSAEICGDTVNIIENVNDNCIFSVGDVCGHGIHTGILGGIVDALIYSNSSTYDIDKLILDMNDVLKEKTPSNMFVSLCLMKWYPKYKKMEYVNAGHEPMLLYRHAENKVEVLDEKGLALGMAKNISSYVHKKSIKMNVGDCILVFSDGIIDAHGKDGKRFGLDHLKNNFELYVKYKKSSTIRNKILKDLKIYVKKELLEDDASVLVIKRKV